MGEWKEVKLGDVGKVVTGKTPLTKVSSYYDGNIHFVSPADLNACGKEIRNTSKTISELGLQSIKGCILPKNAICVSCIGNLGYLGKTTMRCASNQQINSIIVDEDNYDVDFVYYSIKMLWRYFKSQENQSTTISIINKSTFSNISIFAPNLAEQKQIASVLSTLDDKIATNRRICANLEEQAQALFKNWFVDFAPFKDGKFVESELGMIPEGWEVVKVDDLADRLSSGGTPKTSQKEYYYGNINWFSTKELKDAFLFDSEKQITKGAVENSAAKLFPVGSVLMAIYAAPTVGRLGILTKDSTFNQAAVGIVPKSNIGYPFIYLSLLAERRRLNNIACGAAQQNLNVGIVKYYKVIKPNDSVLKDFNYIALNIFENMKHYQQESARLAELRDALLPRLMSGELKV